MSVKVSSDTDALWDAFIKGDDKAFAGIYYAFINALLSYGKKLTRDRELLHDAVQEVFMDLYQKRSRPHTPISNPKAYLFTALKNSILKKILQTSKFEDKQVDDRLLGEFRVEYSFQDQIISREISEEKQLRLQQAIVSLSPGQKEIIYLRFEEDLDYTEIAGILKITVESARKQLYRALLSLRQAIGNDMLMTLFAFFRKKYSKNCPC